MKRYFGLTFILVLSGCSLAPKYQSPLVKIPVAYKESGPWLPVKANHIKHAAWWEMYHDADLNALEAQISVNNQNLRAALARYEQARAAVGVARAGFFPRINAFANSYRQKTSGTLANKPAQQIFSDQLLALDLSYEVDVWGRVRNSVIAASDRACASEADVAVLNLSLQAELASNYFLLRATDASQRVYDKSVRAYQEALNLTERRFKGGASPVADVDQAQTQFETAKTLAANNRIQRGQLEHAIAILIGRTPADFSLPATQQPFTLVTIKPNLPAILLRQRPDIFAAELRVQAANADIGVARAAYFPAINFSSGLGLESASLANLFKAPSLFWSLGPSFGALNANRLPLVNYLLVDGGRTRALTAQAWAVYCENVANYRQTVLTAFQEVEDNLLAIHELDQARKTQSLAARAAQRSLQQGFYRYRGGLTTYLDVVIVQNIALQAELDEVNVKARRQIASVQLVKALGGGWNVAL